MHEEAGALSCLLFAVFQSIQMKKITQRATKGGQGGRRLSFIFKLSQLASVFILVLALALFLGLWLEADEGSAKEEATRPKAVHSMPPPPFTSKRIQRTRPAEPMAAAPPIGQSPLSLLLSAQALKDDLERQAALDSFMQRMTPGMAASLLAQMTAKDLHGDGAHLLFAYFATDHPAQAAIWAEKLADPTLCHTYMNIAAKSWAAKDLPATAAWARGLADEILRSEMTAAVASEAVRSSPLDALTLALELPESPAQTDLIARASSEWAISDPNSVLEWADQIEDTHVKQRVMESVVIASAANDPIGAASIALEMIPGVEQDRAVASIVHRWAQKDPSATAQWVSGFPNDSLGRDVMDELVGLWTQNDPAATGRWLNTLPASHLKTTGIRTFARSLSRTNPKMAQIWSSAAESNPL